MARILGLDFGKKRSGLAVTDPLQIIVTGLAAVETSSLIDYLKEYFSREAVEKIVIGLPTHNDGNYTLIKPDIDALVAKINILWPDLKVDFGNERMSSVDAKAIIMQSGANRKTRQDKALVDKVSAVIILQRYLGHIG